MRKTAIVIVSVFILGLLVVGFAPSQSSATEVERVTEERKRLMEERYEAGEITEEQWEICQERMGERMGRMDRQERGSGEGQGPGGHMRGWKNR